MRPPLVNDAELQERELLHEGRKFTYELVERLTYFVIGVELVFCGYLLLNVKELGGVPGARWAFLAAGTSAICGLLWRVCYNENLHANAHGTVSWTLWVSDKSGDVLYFLYVALAVFFFLSTLVAGFMYLSRIAA